MKLSVVIPTYNRAALLERTLTSLFSFRPPAELDVVVVVVNNRSSDNTAEVSRRFPVQYLYEEKPGRSNALNAGISSSTSELIAMIDDDEEITSSWYVRIAEAFRKQDVDYIGGPYWPKFEISPPRWLDHKLHGVVGWLDFGDEPKEYGPDFPGLLLGGNAVIRREVINKVGPYNTAIGRRGTRLMTGEDDEMYKRLQGVGARGMYYPDLAVYHWIPAARLSKSYVRRWTFWDGVSDGIRDRQNGGVFPRILGIPRYRCGRLARAPLKALRQPSAVFKEELTLWSLAGFCYGRNWFKLEAELDSSN